MSEANGTLLNGQMDHAIKDRLLGEPLTEGYRPSIPAWAMYLNAGESFPQFWIYREIEMMLIHPVVRNALTYFKGAIAGAAFEGPKDLDDQPKPVSENPAVAEFVVSMCRRFWDRGLSRIQNGYEYGWGAVENLYAEKQGGPTDGLLEWVGCDDFLPRDCFLLTQDNRPCGVRVKNIRSTGDRAPGQVDLWFSSGAIPAKGMWYVHNPRYNRHYGQSQLLGAWKPWRRLAWKDAAETVIDGGFYRFAYSGPLVRYPEKDMQGAQGNPATAQSPAGQYFRYARDVARQIAEWMKTGASIGLPSTRQATSTGATGDYEWDVEWPTVGMDGGPLLAYIEYLIKQVREGVGVPSELIEAAETGSGYSGRAIPLEGFMQTQQSIANSILAMYVENVVAPLVLWNRAYFEQYGPLDFEVCVANLLETKLKAAMNPGGAEPGMRGGGEMGEGENSGTQGEGQEGVTWSPINTEGGRAWKSSGGLIRKTQTPPGQLAGASMSLEESKIQKIARKILGIAA